MHSTRGSALRLIAFERALRCLVLCGVGLVLMTHTHTDWGRSLTSLAGKFGLNTSSQGIHRIIVKLNLLKAHQVRAYGAIALAYGVLEGVESWGLFNDRSWAEDLTIVSTALFLIPELWEIINAPTVLKILGTLVNLAVVAYLVRRRQRTRSLERTVRG